MFTQFKNVKNLKISEEDMKKISFEGIVHDALLNKDRNVKIHIPKAFLNAKLIHSDKSSKDNNIIYHSLKCKLRLDFDLVASENENGEGCYYTVTEIYDND